MTAKKLTPTLNLLLEGFLLDARSRGVRPATLAYYRNSLRAFLVYSQEQGAKQASDITAHLIRSYLVAAQDRQLSLASVHTYARAIRSFCNFLVADGLLTESPMKRVTMPKQDKPEPTTFTPDGLKKLCKAADCARDRAIVACLADTGARASEFIAWAIGDVNIATGTVQLTHTKNREPRTVYLGIRARRDLLKLYAELPSNAGDQRIWLNSQSDEPLTTSGLRQMLEDLGAAAGGVKCNPHRFRRFFAYQSLKAGMDLHSLRYVMGHSDLTMLMRYVKLLEKDLRDASKRFGIVDNLGIVAITTAGQAA